jgi:hypothetical protein
MPSYPSHPIPICTNVKLEFYSPKTAEGLAKVLKETLIAIDKTGTQVEKSAAHKSPVIADSVPDLRRRTPQAGMQM